MNGLNYMLRMVHVLQYVMLTPDIGQSLLTHCHQRCSLDGNLIESCNLMGITDMADSSCQPRRDCIVYTCIQQEVLIPTNIL